jgi:catechol 2,3-dioxygenase-like lactoylglutathione lyase family enzyme
MLGRIAAVTLTAPDLAGTTAAYREHLGYRVTHDGALGREVARAWGRPQLAGRRSVLMEPESGAEVFLRFVEGPRYPGYEPLACFGWNAAELIVADVDALAERLERSPFRVVGPPADLSFSDRIRAMQVVGPAGELLYLTQIKERLPAFDTPVAASFVDRVFIVILGGSSLASLQDHYEARFGVPRVPVMQSVVSTLSAKYALPPDHRHPIAALPVGGQCYIEADQMPEAAVARPCDPGELPPGIAMVSFELDQLPVQPASALGPTECPPSPPYGGRRTLTCVGPAGELIELIETEAVGAEIELRVERPQPGA